MVPKDGAGLGDTGLPDAAMEKSRCHWVSIPLIHLTLSKKQKQKHEKKKKKKKLSLFGQSRKLSRVQGQEHCQPESLSANPNPVFISDSLAF